MNITDLLTKDIEVGSRFSAGIVHIDIIDSSLLKGTDQEISSTKDALKALIESLFEEYPIAMIDWRGDGGLLLFYDTKGLDDLVVICDKLINLLQFFNQSRGLCNFLDNDEVHLRIVCHAGFIKNTGSAETLHHEAINYLVKSEREVGVFDHVVVTEDVKKRLSDSLKDRLYPAKEADEKLGLTYILDWRRAATTIQLNEKTQACLWGGTMEGTKYPESSDEAGAYAKPPYAVVKVFYATDRNLTNSSKPSGMYGSNRAPVTYYGTWIQKSMWCY
jgi:hypothetical protein